MANTYSLIAKTQLTGSQASVTFSAIPATYDDLVLLVSARTDDATIQGQVQLRFNNDSSSIYSSTRLLGDGAAASSTRSSATNTSAAGQNGAAGASSTSSTFGSAEIYIPAYTKSQNKPHSGFGVGENNATTARMGIGAGLYSSTTAISRIDISNDFSTVNYVSGSTFWLYGIKNS